MDFSVGVINPSRIPIPKGILIPMGVIPSRNRPKLDFQVAVINPREIEIPKAIKVKS